jgi:hypothetical protein
MQLDRPAHDERLQDVALDLADDQEQDHHDQSGQPGRLARDGPHQPSSVDP